MPFEKAFVWLCARHSTLNGCSIIVTVSGWAGGFSCKLHKSESKYRTSTAPRQKEKNTNLDKENTLKRRYIF